MYTQTITVKIDKKTKQTLDQLSKKTKKGKSELVRRAISKFIKEKSVSGADMLLEMAEEAKEYEFDAPEDIVENMNKYLYGKI